MIESEYLKIDEHEKIVNTKINSLTQEFTIAKMQIMAQFEKDLLNLKQDYEKEISELKSSKQNLQETTSSKISLLEKEKASLEQRIKDTKHLLDQERESNRLADRDI